MGAVPAHLGEPRRGRARRIGGTSSRRARRRRARAARAARPARAPRSAAATRRRQAGNDTRSARAARSKGRRRRTTSAGFAAIPAAVGGIADSSLVVRMARSRAWIAVLAVLLAGIVALNVFGLSLASSISQTAAEADRVEKENALLRAEITEVNAKRGARAAQRAALAVTGAAAATDDLAVTASAEAAEPTVAPPVDPATDPAAVAPIEPVEPPAEPVAEAPVDPNTGGNAAAAGGITP